MSYCWSFEYEIDDAEEAIPIGLSFLPFVRGKEKATGMASLASAVEAGK